MRELAAWFQRIAERRDIFARLSESVSTFAEKASKALKTVAGLLTDIFSGGDARAQAFADIGTALKAAFSDAAALLQNELLPIADRMGKALAQKVYDSIPESLRFGLVDPSKRTYREKVEVRPGVYEITESDMPIRTQAPTDALAPSRARQ